MPIWMFHGALDPIAPLSEAKALETSLRAAGAQPRVTIYPDADHDSWTQAYGDPELCAWRFTHSKGGRMNLGQFSVSLAVQDIAASRAFYEALGFEVYDDHQDENWLILRRGTTVIGLFQGMFEANILTFNPADVRAVQRELRAAGIVLDVQADETGTGPAHIMLTDPDGNTILIDQHDPDYRPTSQA